MIDQRWLRTRRHAALPLLARNLYADLIQHLLLPDVAEREQGKQRLHCFTKTKQCSRFAVAIWV